MALTVQPESKPDATIDGELYRAVVNPKVGIPFEMFKQVYSLQKGVKADDVKVTTDILLEFYAVNKSSSSIYIKEFFLQYQLPGKEVTRLMPESDFSLEMLEMKLEYSPRVRWRQRRSFVECATYARSGMETCAACRRVVEIYGMGESRFAWR